MKIDIHVHCEERSHCAHSTAEEQVRAAIDAHLDALALTDHGRLAPAEEIARLNATYAPFLVLGGIELRFDSGEDVLVLGIDNPVLETRKWDYPALHAFVREQGGFLAIAHPFRYHSDIQIPIQEFPPQAIEICSNNTPREAAGRIAELAHALGLFVLSNSDGHTTTALGRHYNVLRCRTGNERAIVRALRRGAFTAIAREPDGGTRRFTQPAVACHRGVSDCGRARQQEDRKGAKP